MAPYDPKNVLTAESATVQVAVIDSDPITQPIPMDAHVVEFDIQAMTIDEFRKCFYPNDGLTFKVGNGRDPRHELQTKSIQGNPVSMTSVVLKHYGDDLELDLDCLDPSSLIEMTQQLSKYKTMHDLCKVTCALSFPEVIENIRSQQPSYEKYELKDTRHNFVINVRVTNVGDVKDIILKYNFAVIFSESQALADSQRIMTELDKSIGTAPNPNTLPNAGKAFSDMNALEQLNYLASNANSIAAKSEDSTKQTAVAQLADAYNRAAVNVEKYMNENKDLHESNVSTFNALADQLTKLFADEPDSNSMTVWNGLEDLKYDESISAKENREVLKGQFGTWDAIANSDANVKATYAVFYDDVSGAVNTYIGNGSKGTAPENGNYGAFWNEVDLNNGKMKVTTIEDWKDNSNTSTSIDDETGDLLTIDPECYRLFNNKEVDTESSQYDVNKPYSSKNGGF